MISFWCSNVSQRDCSPELPVLRGLAVLEEKSEDDFIKSVQGKVTEGTSALFLMTSDAVLDRVADAFKGIEFEIVTTNLSNEEEAGLHEAFGA